MSRMETGKRAAESKATVFAMVERGGRVRAIVVPDRSKDTLSSHALRHASRHAIAYTDEWPLYIGLGRHFAGHHTIHHKSRVYARGHIHTQAVESFFGLMKNGINGVYRAVSRRYLQSYVDEYVFRYNYNHRHAINRRPMFWNFLDRVQRVSPRAA